jgi:hypothetical protein
MPSTIPPTAQRDAGISRRQFVGTALALGTMAFLPRLAAMKPKQLVLRSSWQTVNIGDIAHTPGMLALLEQHLPGTAVTLWPNKLGPEVEKILRARFPTLTIANTNEEKAAALAACDFFLHGSGPGLVGVKELQRAKDAGKPYGIGGITLNDGEIKNHSELLVVLVSLSVTYPAVSWRA